MTAIRLTPHQNNALKAAAVRQMLYLDKWGIGLKTQPTAQALAHDLLSEVGYFRDGDETDDELADLLAECYGDTETALRQKAREARS